jgi:hypothetical protein
VDGLKHFKNYNNNNNNNNNNTIIEYVQEIESRQARLGGQVEGMESRRGVYRVFAVKPEEKRPF